MSFRTVAKQTIYKGIKVLLSLLALGAGVAELWGPAVFVTEFEKIGFGQWFRYVTGLTLIVGAALLLMEKTTGLGAALLCCVCIGAFFAQFFILHGDIIHTIVPALIFGGLAWRHRDQLCAAFWALTTPNQK